MKENKLLTNQQEILKHTAYRAANGFYCGDSKDMQILVKLGLMKFAGKKPFVPDGYFVITEAGKELLKLKGEE